MANALQCSDCTTYANGVKATRLSCTRQCKQSILISFQNGLMTTYDNPNVRMTVRLSMVFEHEMWFCENCGEIANLILLTNITAGIASGFFCIKIEWDRLDQILNAVAEQTLSPAGWHQPICGRQRHNQQNDYYVATYEGNNLQKIQSTLR